MDNKDNIEVLSAARIEELWGRSCRPEFESDYLSFARNVESEAIAALASQSQAAQPTTTAPLKLYAFTEDGMEIDNAFGHWYKKDDVERLFAAHIAGTSQAQPSERTDLSKRLREAATAEVSFADAKLLIGAAEEIERYYGGMLAWKQTAEKKDRDWNEERMGRVNDRIAAGTSQATKAQAEPIYQTYDIMRQCYDDVAREDYDSEPEDNRRIVYVAPVAKEAPAVLEGWLAYIDPECETEQDKRLSAVSGFMAGQALDEICRLLGGRWPVAKMQEEAPKAYRFFMELFGAAPVASVAKEAARDAETKSAYSTVMDGVDKLAAAKLGVVDTERLDWLDQNIFHREMDEWDAKQRPDQWMWVIFAPKGVQGSAFPARKIIDAAMGYEQGERSDIATTTSTVSAPTVDTKLLVDAATGVMDSYDLIGKLGERETERFCDALRARFDKCLGAQKAPEEVQEGCEHCLHTYCLLGEKCRHCGHEAEGQGYKGGKRTTSTDQANADTGSAE